MFIILIFVSSFFTPRCYGNHLGAKHRSRTFADAECALVLLVDQPAVDLSKIPSNLSHSWLTRTRDAPIEICGHVWILLIDRRMGKCWECGYSAEVSPTLPGYFKGVAQLLAGQMSPLMEQQGVDLDNPIAYLFTERGDGFLQAGGGKHKPTCAMGWAITREQLRACGRAIHGWQQGPYSLKERNCVDFALWVLRACDLDLQCHTSIAIPQFITYKGRRVKLWSSERYRRLTFRSPAALSQSLSDAFGQSAIDQTLSWYSRLTQTE